MELSVTLFPKDAKWPTLNEDLNKLPLDDKTHLGI